MILIEIHALLVSWKAHAGYGKRAFNPRQPEREYYQWQIKAQYNQSLPLSGPLRVYYSFYRQIPKSASKMRTTQMLNGMMHPITRPDLDNYNKFLSDCLNGIVWEDDSQVVELNAKKLYGEKEKTLIRIEPICH
jgi:Holliday junction resolvase RusA-like endonuclease